jgi:uncharacterized RDD family membrane protein YckC
MISGVRGLPDLAVPGIGRRFLSMLYESLVVFAIAFFAGMAFYGAANGQISGGSRLLFQLYLFLILGIYFIACWSRRGRTLPMQTWRIRVVGADDLSVGVGRAALRYALAWPSLLVFGAGFFWAFLDRDRQFLHDRLAGTRIVMIDDTRTGAKDRGEMR